MARDMAATFNNLREQGGKKGLEPSMAEVMGSSLVGPKVSLGRVDYQDKGPNSSGLRLGRGDFRPGLFSLGRAKQKRALYGCAGWEP